jgi:hypothetical protein
MAMLEYTIKRTRWLELSSGIGEAQVILARRSGGSHVPGTGIIFRIQNNIVNIVLY